MSGITSGVGVFSGINTGQIIDQLLSIEARPRTQIQQRVVSLQTQQTSFLDLNSRLASLKGTLTKFTTQSVFSASSATSSKPETLSATAGNGAAVGSYSFVVDRLVSTQQVLSRGFADRTFTGVGATSFTFESALSKVTKDDRLSDLNGGEGVVRGVIEVTDSSGQRARIDLSRVETLQEVAKAIGEGTQGRVIVELYADGLILGDRGGGTGTLTVADAQGTTGTAASLGIAGSAVDSGDGSITGRVLSKLGARSALRTLNDGRGVSISNAGGTVSNDFTITTRDGSVLQIDIGDIYEDVVPSGGGAAVLTKTKSAVTDVAGVLERINQQSGGKVVASIPTDGRGIQLTDTTTGPGSLVVAEVGTGTTAKDLGILGSSFSTQLLGKQVLSGIGTTLVSGIRGGRGLSGTGLQVTTRDGFTTNLNVPQDTSVQQLLESVNSGGNGRFRVELDSTATRVVFKDLTSGSGPLSLSGALADDLGLAVTGSSAQTVQGSRLDRQYIGPATLLSTLNGGRGIGTGQIAITDSYGTRQTINIAESLQTVSDLTSTINSRFNNLRAQINSTGNGIELVEVAKPEGAGASKIKVEDASGGVAKALNLLGEATGTGVANKLDGSFRRTVTFAATDTLQQVSEKITNSNAGVIGAIVDDQASGRPFRLSLTSRSSGEAGRFVVDTGGFDLGLSTLSEGNNSRVFYGSSDPAKGLLLSSSTNTVAGVVPGLSLDVKASDPNPVTVSITRDTATLEKSVDDFVASFNSLIDRIDNLTSYNTQTRRGGPLLGDSSTLTLRRELNAVLNQPAQGISGRYQFLTQVGVGLDREGNVTVNKDRLREAIRTDPQAVQDLLVSRTQVSNSSQRELSPGVFVNEANTGALTSAGVLQRLQDLVDKYTRPVNGVLTRRSQTLTDQVRANNTRIDQLNTRLEVRRGVLNKQFTAMESAIGRLQSQSSSISGIRQVS
jgi:flagellar hook-associated protein 2